MSSPVSALGHDRRIAEALLEISYAVGSVMTIDAIVLRICEIGARVMETDTFSVYLKEGGDGDFLVLKASQGRSRAEELGRQGFRLGEGLAGWAALQNQTLAVNDTSNDERDFPEPASSEAREYLAYLCTPLRIQDEVVGVLSMRRRNPHEWRDEEIVFGEILAKQIAIVLEKARLYNEKVEAERLAAIAISLSEVAHYIKNVLQNMMGGSYFVEAGIKRNDVGKIRQGWELLARSTEKIRALVENMLVFSRENRCALEQGDLNALIARLAHEIEDTAFRRNIHFVVNLDHRVPPVMMDESAMFDALLNLAGNALDAIPAGREGEVRVSSELDCGARLIRIRISDDGDGIPPEVQQKMFNLFYSTKGKGGTGIGLAVTKKIIDEHHGEIFFETEESQGTTFIIELPMMGDCPQRR